MNPINGMATDPSWWSNLGYAVTGVIAAIGGRRFIARYRNGDIAATCTDVVASIEKMNHNLAEKMDMMSNEFGNEIDRTRAEIQTQGQRLSDAIVSVAKDTAVLVDRGSK